MEERKKKEKEIQKGKEERKNTGEKKQMKCTN